jgi:hypothetical protein
MAGTITGETKKGRPKRGQKTYSLQEPKKKTSLTSKVYLLKYQGPKMVHCRIQLLCSCCNPFVASLSSQLSSAATRNMCWSPETSQFELDEKSGFSSQFQSSGFHRPGFNYHSCQQPSHVIALIRSHGKRIRQMYLLKL